MSKFVTIYHGTSAIYRERIAREGLRPRKASASRSEDALQMRSGGPFVTSNRVTALKFARFRTATGVLLRGEPDHALIVTAHLPADRLVSDDRVPEGLEVPGGVAPDELTLEVIGFTSLETEEGCLEALRVFKDWRGVLAALTSGKRVGPGWERPWTTADLG